MTEKEIRLHSIAFNVAWILCSVCAVMSLKWWGIFAALALCGIQKKFDEIKDELLRDCRS